MSIFLLIPSPAQSLEEPPFVALYRETEERDDGNRLGENRGWKKRKMS